MILGVLLLSHIEKTNASCILVYGDLNTTDEEKQQVTDFLQRYTGPSATHFREHPEDIDNPDFQALFAVKPYAEVDFVQHHLREKFPHRSLKVRAIPTTLWDCFAATNYLTNESFKKQVTYNKMESSLFYLISNSIGSTLQSMESLPENSDSGPVHLYKTLCIKYLQRIQLAEKETDHRKISLVNELTKIESGQESILMRMIEEEYQAGYDNKFLIVRSTEGVQLYEEKKDPAHMETYLAKIEGHYLDSIYLCGDTEEKAAELREFLTQKLMQDLERPKWYQGDAGVKILDFPLKMHGSLFGKMASFFTNVQKNNWRQIVGEGKNISYATSLLSGLIFDSFLKKGGACSFAHYLLKQDDFFYALPLPKKWLYTIGNSIFHFNTTLQNLGIFGAGEVFHPRIRGINLCEGEYRDYQNIFTSSIDFECFGRKKESFNFANEETIPEERYRQGMEKMSEYFLETLEFLSENAKIIVMNGQFVDSQESSPEAIQMIANQKLAYEKLKEHLVTQG